MTTLLVIPTVEGKKESKKGMLDGQGTWIDPITGDCWDGVWINSTITYGKLKKRNGIQYIGDFKEAEPCGKGTILWPNQTKFQGYHKNFQLEEGEFCFTDGDRHEGVWINNVPGIDGIRKYTNGGRSKGPIHRIELSKGSQRYRLIFKITGDKRVYEIWNGNKTTRESVEGILSKESLDLELPFLNACANGNVGEVTRILETAPLLSRFAYEIFTENGIVHLNPVLLLAAQRNQYLVVKHLLSAGADISTVNQNMHNAFHIAAKHGNYEILEIICNMTKDYDVMDVHPLDFKDKDGYTPLGLGWELYLNELAKKVIDEDKSLEKCIRVLMRYGADPGDSIYKRHTELGLGWLNVFATPKLESIVPKYEREYRRIPHNLTQQKKRDLAEKNGIWCLLGF